MAKNKTFKRRYTLEIKGVTTNNFMQKVIDLGLSKYVMHIGNSFKQVDIVGFGVEDLSARRETAKELRSVYKCENCGAHKWNDNSICLLCRVEVEDANANI